MPQRDEIKLEIADIERKVAELRTLIESAEEKLTTLKRKSRAMAKGS